MEMTRPNFGLEKSFPCGVIQSDDWVSITFHCIQKVLDKQWGRWCPGSVQPHNYIVLSESGNQMELFLVIFCSIKCMFVPTKGIYEPPSIKRGRVRNVVRCIIKRPITWINQFLVVSKHDEICGDGLCWKRFGCLFVRSYYRRDDGNLDSVRNECLGRWTERGRLGANRSDRRHPPVRKESPMKKNNSHMNE
jgi:hypothetical protein